MTAASPVRKGGLWLVVLLFGFGCASAPPRETTTDPWEELLREYQQIEAIRGAVEIPAGPRRAQVEALLERQRRLEPLHVTFLAKLKAYHETTADPRAATLYARERILLGDDYSKYLARYDRALELYQSALQLDPSNAVVRERISFAEQRMFISESGFFQVQPGMRENAVSEILGYPRIDWMRETIRDGRLFTVWIYPKRDGGAAAVYFDNGVVYHKNWTAAPADS
jgi:tetratricopeptide (TPR) repeat protein